MNRIRLLLILCLCVFFSNLNLKAQIYATLPFTEGFENAWVNKDGIRDVPSIYWKNTPATGSNSWSRNDDGVARGAWSGINYILNSPAAANGSQYSASFNSVEASNNGSLDLFVNFGTLTGPKALYFWYYNSDGDDVLEVSVSTDGGLTFGPPVTTQYTSSGWTKVSVDLGTLTSSTGVVRFTGKHVYYQSAMISIDDIYIGSPSSTPIVADFSADRVSGIAPLTVVFKDKSTGDVTSWYWDFDNDGTIDATTQNPIHTFYTAGSFNVKLTSLKPGISNSKTINITTTQQSYATLPFIEDFEQVWVNRHGTRDVPSLFFKNYPYTGTNSWRRDDDGTSAGWSSGFPPLDYSPRGADNSLHSARFRSGQTFKSGTLDAFIDFSSQTGSKTLSFMYINPSGNDKLDIQLSTDGGITFSAVLLTKTVERDWTKVIYDLGNITSSKGVIRFLATGNNNGLDIGLDDIRISNPSLVSIDANFRVSKSSGPSPLSVNFIDQSGGAPTSWRWDFQNDGVVDATTQNPSFTYTLPGTYTVKLIASNSNYSDEVVYNNLIVVPGYANLPFTESFENAWVNREATRDVPSNFWKNTPSLDRNSWSRNDDGMFRGAWPTNYGDYTPTGANGSTHSAAFDSRDSYNQTGALDLFLNFASQSGEKRLSFWYINRSGNDKLEVLLSTDGGLSFGSALATLVVSGTWTKVDVKLGNLTSTTGVLRFKASSGTSDTNIGIDDVNVFVPATLPLDANFSSSIISGNAPMAVNFIDLSNGAPTLWKWDFNNDGVIDATTQNPSYTFTSPGMYSVKLIISKGGVDDVEVKSRYIVVSGYASIPFSENFEYPWLSRDGYKDTPSAFVKNIPAYGENSWSRDDEGELRGAWYHSGNSYSPPGAIGSAHSARFHSSVTSLSGTLDFYLNFSTMQGAKELSFWYINTYGSDKVEVFLSTDGGATFGNTLLTLTQATVWTKYTVNLGSSISTTCILRFKATGDYNIADIGIDEIRINAIEAGFVANIKSGATPAMITFTDQSTGNPTSWKWDFNNDGVVDATVQNPVHTYTTAGKYTIKLIAQKAGSSDTMVKKDYVILKPVQYASLPFLENFENEWINLDHTRDVPSKHWINAPATGNNSWSRDDDGVARAAWSSQNGAYLPSGVKGSLHSARFHSDFTTSSNNFDLFVNFSTLAGEKNLSFWYINIYGSDKLEVELSLDGGATFNNLTTLATKATWTKVDFNLGNINSSTGVLRFKATGDLRASDIGIDEIKIDAIEANFAANVTSGATPLRVSFTDQSTENPTSWKWDFNNDGIIDATTQNPVYSYTSSGKYTVKLVASKPGSVDSIVKTDYITVKPIEYAALPFVESFDNDWIGIDNTRDVPSNKWSNNPATGNNSWSRDDDGVARSAWISSYGSYTPAGYNSTHSARFHSYYTKATNNFDLFVNFSTLTGDKALYFWYINKDGLDNLEVLISTDAGLTFRSLALLNTKNVWAKIALDLGNLTSSTGIIRFKASGDNGGSDIGIDEVFVGSHSSIPIKSDFITTTAYGMAPFLVNFTDQSSGDVTSWKWDFNADGIIESTLQNPSYVYTKSGAYNVKLIASKSGVTDSVVKTNIIAITPQAYASVPFREGFEKSWVTRDYLRDVPNNCFLSIPSSGNNSWSRSDDMFRAWTNSNRGSMPGACGTFYSARFNSLKTDMLSGTLDLFLDFSSQFGIQQLSFWYLNVSGTDKLEVYLSKDGGVTFNTALKTLNTVADWTRVTVDLGFVTASKCVIRFKATGDGGTTDIAVDEIVVCDPSSMPISADFSSNISSGNKPLVVNFTDQSVGIPSSWKWDFNNDGIIDAVTQNPSFTYSSPGVYSVKMVAANAETKDSIIKVNCIVVPGYASLPLSENFDKAWVSRDGLRDVPSYFFKNIPATGENSWSNSEDGVLRGAWAFLNVNYPTSGANNSQQSARFHSTYTTSSGNLDLFVDFSTLTGSKTLEFWYINALGTDSLNVYLSTDGGATEGSLITTKKIASAWTKITVDLGNITSSTGVIRFKAKGDGYNSDLGIDEITIGATASVPVEAKFSANVNYGIAPLTVKFINQSVGTSTSWKWDFNNDGRVDSTTLNPSYTFAKSGKYSVCLEASGAGTTNKETKVNYITVFDKVKADFSANIVEGFAPLAVYFTNKSTGIPDSWKWDFDNNGSIDATSENAYYMFTQPGSYNVKLIVSNLVSKDTVIKPLLIRVKSKATLPYTENFDDDWKSYQATRDVPSFNWINSPADAMYSWSRDDDGVERGAWNSNDAAYTPSGADGSPHSARFHTYDFMDGYLSRFTLNVDFSSLAGNKTLSFYYINPGGTDGLKVYLSTNGGTSFGTALTTQTTTSVWTKVSVDLGNVTSANGVILFEVSADLDNTDIGIDELSIQTTGITPIAARFSSDVTSGIAPLTVKFTDQSTGSPTSWKWDFNNDGIIDSTTQNPSYVFTQKGTYSVRMISSSAGSTDSETKLNYIRVEDPVDAKFTVDKTSGTNPLTVVFTDQSSGSPTIWSWDFDNNGTVDAITQNPTYTYNLAGTYTVKLTASKTNSSDVETKISHIVVIDPVVADFSANKTTGVISTTISFTDKSTGNPTSWKWDFNNDGVIDATSQNPSFTYNSAGTFTVKLVASKTGSTDTETKTSYIVIVSTPVITDFSANKTTGIVPVTIDFLDKSTGNPTDWNWDFNNDGTIDATTKNPSYTFLNPGTYTVSLVSSKLGSSDKKIQSGYITIIGALDADFIADKLSGPAPLTVKFTNLSTGSPTDWSWDFNNDGITDSITQNPSYTFASSGIYTVKLTVSNLGFPNTEIKTRYITVSPSTAIGEAFLNKKEVLVYPNPASAWAKMKFENFGNEDVTCEIIDIHGTILSVIDLTGKDFYDLNLTGFARGIYYLKTYTKDKVFINKLVLQ